MHTYKHKILVSFYLAVCVVIRQSAIFNYPPAIRYVVVSCAVVNIQAYSSGSHTFKGTASRLSAVPKCFLRNMSIPQEVASLPGKYEYSAGST